MSVSGSTGEHGFIETRSLLAAPAERVWRDATGFVGINGELAPWLKMTAPPGMRDLAGLEGQIELGKPIMTSWLLLLGLLPVDRMRVTLLELDVKGRRFVEQSPLLALRSWRHERWVLEVEGGAELVDRVTPGPRWPVPPALVRWLVSGLFRHRHRRLRQRYGAIPAPEHSRG